MTFECKVGQEMAEFLSRYDPERDFLLSAVVTELVRASVAIDGSDPLLPLGLAHLRWFVVDAALRGQGVGKQLLSEAIEFARDAGFAGVYLTTFRGLEAAAALYATAGFRVVAEEVGESWGREVAEQRLEMRF
ncbi:MAG: N-acetyltransferase [Acetobacteraceae bacterium]|nr:N-acetyltransferase [Acetobacteraceae bacterium]